MELNNLFEIWDRFEVSSVSELEIDMQGVHFALKKQNGAGKLNSGSSAEAHAFSGTEKQDLKVSEFENAAKTKPAAEGIKAPLVGTFYAAPSPEAEPFVKVGSKVKAGDVVCIIEAMKMMNEVRANISGTVREVLVKDGSMIEYGQLMFVIE